MWQRNGTVTKANFADRLIGTKSDISIVNELSSVK